MLSRLAPSLTALARTSAGSIDAYSDETYHLFHGNACHSFHTKLGHLSGSKPSQRLHLKVGHRVRTL